MSVITDCPYICAPNIMDTPDYQTKMVTLDMTGQTVIKAGTPISAEGKAANDETAIGILLNDCHACLGAHRGLVVISGRIKQDVAAEHSGITISDEAKSAMINLTFTGDGARGGGGGVQPDWSQNDETAPDYVKSRPGGYNRIVWGDPIETTVTFTADTNGQNNYIEAIDHFEKDDVCNVEIDGVLYENVPAQGDSIGWYLGDPELKEYPFVLNYPEYAGSGTYWCYSLHTDPGEKNVVVTIGKSTAVKFPPRYIDYSAVNAGIQIARTSAYEAKTLAETAQETAEVAQSTAEAAQATAEDDTHRKDASYLSWGQVQKAREISWDGTPESTEAAIVNSGVTCMGFYGYFHRVSNLFVRPEYLSTGDATVQNKFQSGTLGQVATIGACVVSEDGKATLFGSTYTFLQCCSFEEAGEFEFNFVRSGSEQNVKLTASKAGTYFCKGTINSTSDQWCHNLSYKELGDEIISHTLLGQDALTIYSSTADSTKRFRITVDDSGTLSATEVTE